MFSTDFLGLSDQKILKAIRDTLPKELNTTQNVLVISDGVLFAWDFDSSCVLTLNVRSARSKEGDGGVAYQVSFVCLQREYFVVISVFGLFM